MDISFTVFHCVCAILFVCTVTDFSAEDKASGVKYCTAVHRSVASKAENFTFWGNFALPETPNQRAQ